MNFFFIISSVVFSVVVLGLGSDALRIRVEPEKSIATTREDIEISCVQDIGDVSVREITVMEVYRNDEAPIAVLSHCTNITYGTQTSSRFQAVGAIDKDLGNSFLNLTLSNPTSADTGVYTCVMYYLDQEGFMKDQKASQNVLIESLDVKSLETVLNTMKNKITQLEGKLTESNRIDSMIIDKMDMAERNQSQQISDMREKMKVTERNHLQQLSALEEKDNFMMAFSATNNKTSITASNGKIVVLPDLITRYGKGYDENTGIFTSTREGLYAFHVVATNSGKSETMLMDLRANDEVIARLFTRDTENWEQSSMTAVVHLKAGDKVFAVLKADHDRLRHGLYSVFTGYLIHTF